MEKSLLIYKVMIEQSIRIRILRVDFDKLNTEFGILNNQQFKDVEQYFGKLVFFLFQ